MSNSLLEKIKAEAIAQAAEIDTKSKEAIAAYEAETKILLEKAKQIHSESLEKEKAHLETVTISKARQAGNIATQAAKREGVNSVFNAVFTDIKDAPSDEYVAFFTSVAKKVVPQESKGTVYAPAERVEETTKILKEQHIDATIKDRSDIAAGFILDTADGVYDVTLERIFLELRPRLEVEILTNVQ